MASKRRAGNARSRLADAASNDELHAVDMTREDAAPQVLFREIADIYDVSPDGQRFLIAHPVNDITTIPLTFVSHWDR